MVKIPTERRYEEYIESYLTSIIDDGLQFSSRIHKTTDGWYDKNLCLVGDDFIQFLKETQKDTYDTLLKKYGDNTDSNILKRLDKEIDDIVQLEQKKIEILKEYRQSLISEVVTGKIKVTN